MIAEIILGILLLILLWNAIRPPSHFPPGYWGLPLIGYIPLRTNDLERVLIGLHMKFGRMVSWKIGTRKIVSIKDYRLCKEAFSRPEFSSRPEILMLRMLYPKENLGLIGSNDEVWQNGRRFTLQHLRNFGMGKSKLDSAVQHQAEALVQEFKKIAGKPSPVPEAINIAVLNVIWSMVANKEYSFEDPQIVEFQELLNSFITKSSAACLPDFFPWIEYVIPRMFFRKIIAQDLVDDIRSKFIAFIMDIIEDHEKNLDEDNPRDYIEAYLGEMKKQENDFHSTMSRFATKIEGLFAMINRTLIMLAKNVCYSHFQLEKFSFGNLDGCPVDRYTRVLSDAEALPAEKNLLTSVQDLFIAGSESTSSMIAWSIYYLAAFPEVQKHLQKEVDDVLHGTLATLQDYSRLPYTEAFLHELHRHVSLGTIGAIHLVTRDSYLGGHLIPKGTYVVPYIRGCHYDPTFWKKPDEFHPTRFLSEDRKFVLPKEGFFPFGTGKRQCLGESLARMELLIFLTTLVQHFNFSPSPGKQMDLSNQTEVIFLRFPKRETPVLTTVR